MGTVVAASYTTVYLNEFENMCIYLEIKNDWLFYEKYIDDIFIIYTGEYFPLRNNTQ